MKNIIWINWLINNPIVMWTILGIIVALAICVGIIFIATNRK